MYSIHIIIIIKNENIKVTLCENAAGALYISINTIQYLQQFPHLFRIKNDKGCLHLLLPSFGGNIYYSNSKKTVQFIQTYFKSTSQKCLTRTETQTQTDGGLTATFPGEPRE